MSTAPANKNILAHPASFGFVLTYSYESKEARPPFPLRFSKHEQAMDFGMCFFEPPESIKAWKIVECPERPNVRMGGAGVEWVR